MSEVERDTRQLGAIQESMRYIRDSQTELPNEMREGLGEVRSESKATRRLLIGMLSSVLIALLITIATQYGGG